MSDLPRITVILVATITGGKLEDRLEAPLEGPVLAAIRSVEDQLLYPKELVDLTIVRNVDGYPLHDMHRFAAQRATTEWLAFVLEDEVKPPHWLHNAMGVARNRDRSVGVREGINLGVWRKDLFLEFEVISP